MDLSIIIPVYNTEKYIGACLDSLMELNISQFEIIIVDDGSTDSSRSIIDSYNKKFNNIKYFYQTNNGQGSARNLGILKSSGKYIYFMDSDDILSPVEFTKVYKAISEENLDAIFFDGESFVDPEFDVTPEFNIENYSYHRKKSYGYYDLGEDLFSDLNKYNDFIISPCLYIVKRKVYIENSLKFPLNIKQEDEVFTSNLLFFIGSCRHVNQVGFLRRLRANSTMTTLNLKRKFHDLATVINYMATFYSTFNFKTSQAKKNYFIRIRKIYLITLDIFYSNQFSANDPDYISIKRISKKFNHFDLIGRIADVNYRAYKTLVNVKLYFQKIFKLNY